MCLIQTELHLDVATALALAGGPSILHGGITNIGPETEKGGVGVGSQPGKMMRL